MTIKKIEPEAPKSTVKLGGNNGNSFSGNIKTAKIAPKSEDSMAMQASAAMLNNGKK